MKMKKSDGGGGGANWMDTYGDMVTLLLCFFVLLYSMSTVDENKWKALVQSFNPDAIETPTDPKGNDGPNADPLLPNASSDTLSPEEIDAQAAQKEVDSAMEDLYQMLMQYIQDSGKNIEVTKGDGVVYVNFDDTVFFDGEEYVIKPEGEETLNVVCGVLDNAAPYIDEVRVLGHTAQSRNIPNTSIVDRTLAAQRAAVVVAYFQDSIGYEVIHPGRYVAEGYGQWRNVADNSTAEGKARNRRVEIIISGRDLENELNDDYRQYYTMSDTNTGNTTEFTADGNAAVSYSTNGN